MNCSWANSPVTIKNLINISKNKFVSAFLFTAGSGGRSELFAARHSHAAAALPDVPRHPQHPHAPRGGAEERCRQQGELIDPLENIEIEEGSDVK